MSWWSSSVLGKKEPANRGTDYYYNRYGMDYKGSEEGLGKVLDTMASSAILKQKKHKGANKVAKTWAVGADNYNDTVNKYLSALGIRLGMGKATTSDYTEAEGSTKKKKKGATTGNTSTVNVTEELG